jgi:hypothetical protein
MRAKVIAAAGAGKHDGALPFAVPGTAITRMTDADNGGYDNTTAVAVARSALIRVYISSAGSSLTDEARATTPVRGERAV